MKLHFPTSYPEIFKKMEDVNPVKYGKSRNYIDGAVTYLSPYISRGVISTQQVLEYVLAKGYKISQIESFVKELCWRDYFQRVAQWKNINLDIKQPQEFVAHHEIPSAIVGASTGIDGIDNAIQQLYSHGYMHNHCRMYTASLVCNIAKSHWYLPAKWMYFHLLDGDWASNACSWQWVAGANSNKKYYANQENINRYTHTQQSNTFLDKSYEEIQFMDIPSELLSREKPVLQTIFPSFEMLKVDKNLPTFIYNYYNLDPLWHKNEPGNRILLLEPEHFLQYPVNENCIQFVLELSKNIPEIQVYVGSFDSFTAHYGLDKIFYKEHPFNSHYKGAMENRDWMAEIVDAYYPSFFAYWKKVEPILMKKYN